MFASTWVWFGYCFVVFLAGLQAIDPNYYDAAHVDGANMFQRFRHITIPGLRNVTSFITWWSLTAGFQVFDIVFLMTSGGPANSTQVLGVRTYYYAFGGVIAASDKVGYGAAVAFILGAIVFAVSFTYLRLTRSKSE